MADRSLPGWPRGMREELAAAYIGLSESGLRAEVKAGRIKPTPLTPGRIVYLREHLDSYLDKRDGRAPVEAAAAPDGSEWLASL